MAELVMAGRVLTKRRIQGIVPPQIFLEQPKKQGYAVNFSTLLASATIWKLAETHLGLPRKRLWIVLGGEPAHSWRTGRKNRLSHVMTTRLAFLFYLKDVRKLNSSALYNIDWVNGIVFFNQGQPVTLEMVPRKPIVVEEREKVTAS